MDVNIKKNLFTIYQDDALDIDKYITSPLAIKARCSTPLTKIPARENAKFSDHYIILDEMRLLLPNVLNEMKNNGHLET